MPNPLESLAVWSVITGLLFMFRSPGVAYNEVMVALLEEPESKQALRRVARNIAIGTTLVILVFVLTPLSELWLQHIAALLPDLVETGRIALILGIPLGVLSVYVSYFQGFLGSPFHNKRRCRSGRRLFDRDVGCFGDRGCHKNI